jgi:hypothetical protein
MPALMSTSASLSMNHFLLKGPQDVENSGSMDGLGVALEQGNRSPQREIAGCHDRCGIDRSLIWGGAVGCLGPRI